MRRILFVDDEPRILEGLENALFSVADDWDMSFAESGQDALKLLADEDFDVLVTDMRMPGMSGAELLRACHERHPSLIRIVLSGHAEVRALLDALPVSHQFFAKPCDGELLYNSIEQIFRLQDTLGSPRLNEVIAGLTKVPTRPKVYDEITRLLADEDASLRDVADAAEHDVVIATRLIQFANSAFFAGRVPPKTVWQSVQRLGGSLVRDLVLASEIFRPTPATTTFNLPAGYTVDAIGHRSHIAGQIAQELAPEALKDKAFLAGLVHDFGHLLFLANETEGWLDAIERAGREGRSVHACERETLGVSHAEVGAAVLGTWGFSYDLLDAVANHHTPGNAEGTTFGLAGLVHIANALATPGREDRIDRGYLERVGQLDNLEGWIQVAANLREAAQ